MVLFAMLYKVVLTFKSVNETLKCDHSNESNSAVLSRDALFCAKWLYSAFKAFDRLTRA